MPQKLCEHFWYNANAVFLQLQFLLFRPRKLIIRCILFVPPAHRKQFGIDLFVTLDVVEKWNNKYHVSGRSTLSLP